MAHLCFVATFTVCCLRSWAGVELYVGPNGSDGAHGTREHPFGTLARARDAIREMRATKRTAAPVTVFVRAGTYALSETLSFDARDSGTVDAPIVFRAYPGERPVLTGGRPISDFRQFRGAILKANVGIQGFAGKRFGLLIFRGRRREIARTPSRDPSNRHGGKWAYVDGQRMSMYADRPDENGYLSANRNLDFWQRNIPRYTRMLQVRPGDMPNWEHPEDGDVSLFPRFNWTHYLLPIESYDAASGILALGPGSFYEVRPGDRYFVRGHLEDLDSPGEWYLDPRTQTLYFWPPIPVKGSPAYAPVVDTVVAFVGCSYVTLRGFVIECCERSAVVIKDCEAVMVAGCTIRNVGGADGAGVVVEGGRNNAIVGNDIHDTGASGVRLGGGDLLTLTPGGHRVDNNHIHHVGAVGRAARGIEVTGALHSISHNFIHDTPHAGIFMWGAGHTVEYNRILRTCLETEDCGAIGGGAIDWLSWHGVTIRHNWIQDTMGFGYDEKVGRWRSPYFAHALYADWGASGVKIFGNIFVRAPVSCLHLHSGRDNVIQNNILVDGGETQLAWTGWTTSTGFWSTRVDGWVRNYQTAIMSSAWRRTLSLRDPRTVPLPDGRVMYGNSFRRNIVCWRSPGASLVRLQNVPLEEGASDYNLLYHYGRPISTGVLRLKSERGPNLLANPDLSEGPLGGLPAGWAWALKATEHTRIEVVEGVGHEDDRCLLIEPAPVNNGSTTAVGYVAPGPPQLFRPGRTYRLALWMRAERGPISVAIQAYSWKKDTHSWVASRTVLLSNDWREYDLLFRLPPTNDPAYRPTMDSFCPRLMYTAGPGEFWVDDVSLREADAMSEWEAWQAAGMDRHSRVADPLFMNPTHDDYRLRPDSPAFRLGFKPIPVEEIGCYKDALRATWPVRACR